MFLIDLTVVDGFVFLDDLFVLEELTGGILVIMLVNHNLSCFEARLWFETEVNHFKIEV